MGEQKSLLQKLKELVRLPRFTRPGAESEPSSDRDAGMTVEREPDTASEDAVKGTSTADTTATADEVADGTTDGDDTVTGDAAPTADAETDTGAEPVDEGTPVEEIKGIGPTYAGRLETAGLDTVEALAGADAARVADVAQTSKGKASTWIERANDF